MRTLPLRENLNATLQEGIFLKCRLASDNEPERRNWKVTLRSDTSRGEQVYQAAFTLPKPSEGKEDEWNTVQVPFDEFQLVRGPRLIPNAPPLDTSRGLFQIGLSMSKFVIGYNTTELTNFRAGFFELHLAQIGFYKSDTAKGDVLVGSSPSVPIPETLSPKEVKQKRPFLLKVLLPLAKVLFSEKANRRKSAMNILREQRGWSRSEAVNYGFQSKRKSLGLIPALMKTLGILGIDSFRTVLKSVLKVVLVYPLRLVSMLARAVKLRLGMKVKPENFMYIDPIICTLRIIIETSWRILLHFRLKVEHITVAQLRCHCCSSALKSIMLKSCAPLFAPYWIERRISSRLAMQRTLLQLQCITSIYRKIRISQ